jgi:hypothetical protein
MTTTTKITTRNFLDSAEKVMTVAGRIAAAYEGNATRVREVTGLAQANFREALACWMHGEKHDAVEYLADAVENLRPVAQALDIDHLLP